MKPQQPPVLVFGFDAGDPDLLLGWALDGTLPALGSILLRGCHARFAGPEMVSEHGMWVSLTSGISRARHGYYWHRQLVPGTYDLMPARGRHLACRPFWRHLTNRNIAIIDVPDIAAPEPGKGMQISEWATHYPYFPAATEPPELLREIHSEFGRRQFIDEVLNADLKTDRKIFAALMHRLETKKELCLRYLSRGQWDLAVVVFGECHTGAHQFWKYQKSKTGPLANAVKDLYRATDEVLGSILKGWPEQSPVFVVSSVGLKEQWPAAGLNEAFCRELGYQVPSVPGKSASNRPIDILRRLIPEKVRNQLSRFVSEEKQALLLSDKFRASTDWSRTTLFSIPAYYTGQFRVNLAGREPCGIVQPGQEYEDLLDRVETDLLALVDPVTNKPAIKAVRRTSHLFGGNPPESLPDILAEWADAEHFMERVRHPRVELVQSPCEFHRSTDHSQFGFLAAAGEGVMARGDIGEVSPLDLAPTLLSHLGYAGAEKFDGKPIVGLTAPSDQRSR